MLSYYGFSLNNAFVTKFNPRGSALMYSTYLGGTTIYPCDACVVPDGDVATGVAIDTGGNAYVTGRASSYNFPVTNNAYQKVNHAAGAVGPNAFVTKLNPTGSALVYSTYVGGSGGDDHFVFGDGAVGIAVDPAGDAYIAGTALSGDFPVTANAFQQGNNAGYGPNLFVTKLNPAGSALVYSTYLGGSGWGVGPLSFGDSAGGIAIDSAGDAYVTGTAYSRDFPVTANAYQKVNNAAYYSGTGGSTNAIITELNPTGSALVYSTYLGGSNQAFGDSGGAIALNAAGNAYVTGYASSTDFPVTPHAFRKVNTNGDGFVTELNSAGSALVYSTFLGGGGAGSIALDAFGSAYLTGSTYSTSFPVTSDAFRKANHGNADAFVSKLDATGSIMLYSSYLGGSGSDYGNGIAVDWFGDAYIAGRTCSTDFPLASVPFQTTNKGTGCTAFVSKFIVNTVTTTKLTSNSNPGRVGTTATFTASVTPNTGTAIPTGSVIFTLDGTPEVTVSLDGSGQATYSTSSLAAGRYTITATYLGNATTSGSIANLGQLIIGSPARITVASGTYQTAVEGSPFAMPLVALVQDERGMPVPGAVVDFSGAGLTFSGNPAVTNADGNASVIATPTATGSLTAMATTPGVSVPATFKLTATQPAP
ncbi:MAG: SBBP repeat-containing protein [Silvibacterium sp.]